MVEDLQYKIDREWQYTEDSYDGVGRFDVTFDVIGHPEYDAIRYFYTPGYYQVMEWVKDGWHYDNEEAPIPDEVRLAVLALIADDLQNRLLIRKVD